jgi:hypothetical protein
MKTREDIIERIVAELKIINTESNPIATQEQLFAIERLKVLRWVIGNYQ